MVFLCVCCYAHFPFDVFFSPRFLPYPVCLLEHWGNPHGHNLFFFAIAFKSLQVKMAGNGMCVCCVGFALLCVNWAGLVEAGS